MADVRYSNTGQVLTPIEGAAASGAAAVGNPIPIAGLDSSSNLRLPTVMGSPGGIGIATINGLIAHAILFGRDASANLQPIEPATTIADAIAAAKVRLMTRALLSAYNGATEDTWRNNAEITVLASADRTAQTDSADQTNHNARGIMLFLDITANPGGAETLSLRIVAKTVAQGKIRGLLSFPAIAAATNGTYLYILYPGASETIAEGSVEVQAEPLPRTWFARILHSSTGIWTYSLAGCYIV